MQKRAKVEARSARIDNLQKVLASEVFKTFASGVQEQLQAELVGLLLLPEEQEADTR